MPPPDMLEVKVPVALPFKIVSPETVSLKFPLIGVKLNTGKIGVPGAELR